MFNNYFHNYIGFTLTPKGKLPLNFTMPDIKIHGTENPHHQVRNVVSVMALKAIDKNIFHIIFLKGHELG